MLDNGEKKVAQCLFFKCLTDTQFTFIEEKEKKPDNIHISQADSREWDSFITKLLKSINWFLKLLAFK